MGCHSCPSSSGTGTLTVTDSEPQPPRPPGLHTVNPGGASRHGCLRAPGLLSAQLRLRSPLPADAEVLFAVHALHARGPGGAGAGGPVPPAGAERHVPGHRHGGPGRHRYWHSTAAYAIATEVSGAVQHLPPAHHPIYQWPKDLLRPNLVVLLTVSPEERLRRIRGRGPERTSEEEELEANSVFRQKVEVSYERMESPGCHAVDASPSRERVLQAVLSLIRDHCPQRP
ncbi:PREDICTED: UMP-CMP kinase 2, mitochondrial [Myotis brandtii]|uniref:UMP-CMP kinase 2, mitochondrial n=1 Tax=Myotis brandtii TaxID=109478 RepID=UPI000703F8F6|nr:PREDICTED: UMP-CMP kinase 2, mitochondrial [Myotis brandtii]